MNRQWILVIKGSEATARAELTKRGIETLELADRYRWNETVCKVNATWAQLTAWFAEGGYDAPFPEGTLLLFR